MTNPVSNEANAASPPNNKDLRLLAPNIQKGMGTINLLSMPLRAMEDGVIAACGVNETTQRICQLTAEGIKAIVDMVPESARTAVNSVITELQQDLPQRFYSKYGIPKDETTYFLESTGYLVEAAISKGVVKTTTAACRKLPVLLGKGPEVKFKEVDLSVPGEYHAEFQYWFQKRNQSLKVFVAYLGVQGHIAAGTPTKTHGIALRALKELKSLAKEHQVKDLYIQWVPANTKLLDIAFKYKKLDYVGNKYYYFMSKSYLALKEPKKFFHPVFKWELGRSNSRFLLETVVPVAVPTTVTSIQYFLPSNRPNSFLLTSPRTDLIPFAFTLADDDATGPQMPNFALKSGESAPYTPNFAPKSRESDVPVEEPPTTARIDESLQAADPEPEMALSTPDDDALSSFGQQILEFAGEVSGVRPAMDELRKVNEIIQCLAKNPQEAPAKIVSELLKKPIDSVKHILNAPNEFSQNIERFLQNPDAAGAIAIVGGIKTFMDSVSWVCEFARKPGKASVELVKMPYTCVKGVIDLGVTLIRHPEKAAKQMFRSVIKMPKYTIKRFLRATGLRRKKKKHRHEPEPTPTIDPKRLEQLVAKYVIDLPALYFLARTKGFIDPYKTVEEYHHDLLEDYMQGGLEFPNGYFDFPQFLVAKMEANSLVYLRTYSPRAHPDSSMISPEVLLASMAIDETLGKLETTFEELDVAHQKHEEIAQQLSFEQKEFSRATGDLGTTLAQNREKIKQALINKKN